MYWLVLNRACSDTVHNIVQGARETNYFASVRSLFILSQRLDAHCHPFNIFSFLLTGEFENVSYQGTLS